MVFNYNAGEGEADSGGFLTTPGRYVLKITSYEEKETGKGYPMIVVDVEVVSAHDPQNNDNIGKDIKYHNVVFIPEGKPGVGFAKLFLKCIGEPYKGAIKIIPEQWLNKTFVADVDLETYTDKHNKEKEKNTITPIDEEKPTAIENQSGNSSVGSVDEEKVPF